MKVHFPKYALNLTWFILLVGSISLFDRGVWAILGLLILMQSLLSLLVVASNYYLNKPFTRISENLILKAGAASTVILALLHLILGKKGLKWELALILVLCAAFIYYVAQVKARGKESKPE